MTRLHGLLVLALTVIVVTGCGGATDVADTAIDDGGAPPVSPIPTSSPAPTATADDAEVTRGSRLAACDALTVDAGAFLGHEIADAEHEVRDEPPSGWSRCRFTTVAVEGSAGRLDRDRATLLVTAWYGPCVARESLPVDDPQELGFDSMWTLQHDGEIIGASAEAGGSCLNVSSADRAGAPLRERSRLLRAAAEA